MGKITRALQKLVEERSYQPDSLVSTKEYKKFIVPHFRESKIDPRLITYFDQKSIVSEQYKILTTNLLSLNKRKPPQTIAITSSIAGEWKKLPSLNFSLTG